MKGLQTFLNEIEPIRNTDACEDVAGGLLVSCSEPRGLHSSSLILEETFCWNGIWGMLGAGKTIEDLMQLLCSRRISYYFAAITKYTDKMARIMQDCYAHGHNAEFKARFLAPIIFSTSSNLHNFLHSSSKLQEWTAKQTSLYSLQRQRVPKTHQIVLCR